MKHDEKIKNNIELISLHIPKTAGTSFRNILKNVYGKSGVARLDIRKNLELNERAFRGTSLKSKIRVVHGHFSYNDLNSMFELPESCPIITWLRDPAERVISNFYYLENVLKKEFKSRQMENIRKIMQKSLLEYARSKKGRNRMSKFLKGIDPEALFFIGITEHYEEELKQLSELLGWGPYPILSQNMTGNKPVVDEQTRQEIMELNEADYEIYNKAIEIRAERIKSLS